MSYYPRLTRRQAESVPWCLVHDGVVHGAYWLQPTVSPEHPGFTTLHSDDDDAGDPRTPGTFELLVQIDVTLAQLRAGEHLMWRERSSLKLPICQLCEEDYEPIDRY